jgi:hypothetical protein
VVDAVDNGMDNEDNIGGEERVDDMGKLELFDSVGERVAC